MGSAFIYIVRTENVFQAYVPATFYPRMGLPFLEKDLVEIEHPNWVGRLPSKGEGEAAINDCLSLDVLEIATEQAVAGNRGGNDRVEVPEKWNLLWFIVGIGWKSIRILLAPLIIPVLLSFAHYASNFSFTHPFESELLTVHGYLDILLVIAVQPKRECLDEGSEPGRA